MQVASTRTTSCKRARAKYESSYVPCFVLYGSNCDGLFIVIASLYGRIPGALQGVNRFLKLLLKSICIPTPTEVRTPMQTLGRGLDLSMWLERHSHTYLSLNLFTI